MSPRPISRFPVPWTSVSSRRCLWNSWWNTSRSGTVILWRHVHNPPTPTPYKTTHLVDIAKVHFQASIIVEGFWELWSSKELLQTLGCPCLLPPPKPRQRPARCSGPSLSQGENLTPTPRIMVSSRMHQTKVASHSDQGCSRGCTEVCLHRQTLHFPLKPGNGGHMQCQPCCSKRENRDSFLSVLSE